jgi:hypothetical protein
MFRSDLRQFSEWAVYAGITYRNFLILYFILALINIYYIHLYFPIFLKVYLSFTLKKYNDTSEFPLRILPGGIEENHEKSQSVAYSRCPGDNSLKYVMTGSFLTLSKSSLGRYFTCTAEKLINVT